MLRSAWSIVRMLPASVPSDKRAAPRITFAGCPAKLNVALGMPAPAWASVITTIRFDGSWRAMVYGTHGVEAMGYMGNTKRNRFQCLLIGCIRMTDAHGYSCIDKLPDHSRSPR